MPLQRESLGTEVEEEDSSFVISRETKADKTLLLILEAVMLGRVLKEIRRTLFAKIFEELSVDDSILVKGERIVVPDSLTNCVIELSHQSHGLRG